MNYTDFVKTITEKTGLKSKDTRPVVDAIFETIAQAVIDHDEVSIPQFGKFKSVVKPERTCRNPKTGEPMVAPEHGAIKFTPSTILKNAVR